MESAVSKFTRILPLSIRKDSSNNGGGSVNINQQNSGGNFGGGGGGDRAFFREPVGSEMGFRDAFDCPAVNLNMSPSSSSVEQKELVRVSVTYPSPSAGTMNSHKEISLRLTNDENPMFFYHLRITEGDYPQIKSQQGLLVDFYGFPNQLVSLLEKCDPNCVNDGDEGKGGMSQCPKFVLVMKVGMNSVLDIVESNPFKYLCHLSLQICPGTDTEVKKYLADVTTGLKKECGLWQEKYSHLSSAMEGELTRVKGLLEQRNEELRQLRDEIHTQANSLSSRHFHDMTMEKEKLLKIQSELASKFESERQEIDRRHSQAIAAMEGRMTSLEAENRDLTQTKFKNESLLQDITAKNKTLDEDLKLLQQEITLSRKQNEKLDRDYHDKHRITNSLQNRLAVLESDIKEKQNTVQRQQDYISQLSEQKKFLEDHTSNIVKEVEKLKTVNKNVSCELIKANEIIKKLQDDIRSLHTKNKLQVKITFEQERRLSDREEQIRALEEAVSKLKTRASSHDESEALLKHELEESKSKIESLENTVKSNENMISWLNKQLNEFQGLGNLSKFRQNLNLGSAASNMPLKSLQESGLSANSAAAVNGSLRNQGLFTNLQNTLPNGTPSWMHIYQSTSTPLENDLQSRFERTSASNNNYSLGRSRLDTISEKTGDTNFTTGNQQHQYMDVENRNPCGSNDSNNQKEAISTSEKVPKVVPKMWKPPTWARPRSGKVTLDAGAPSKPNPIWRNT